MRQTRAGRGDERLVVMGDVEHARLNLGGWICPLANQRDWQDRLTGLADTAVLPPTHK